MSAAGDYDDRCRFCRGMLYDDGGADECDHCIPGKSGEKEAAAP